MDVLCELELNGLMAESLPLTVLEWSLNRFVYAVYVLLCLRSTDTYDHVIVCFMCICKFGLVVT